MADGGGNTDLQSCPSPCQGRVSVSKQLKEAGVFMGPDYHNPNPWIRLLGRANESEIEIDGKIGTTLIYSCAMILMMSREYCDEHRY